VVVYGSLGLLALILLVIVDVFV